MDGWCGGTTIKNPIAFWLNCQIDAGAFVAMAACLTEWMGNNKRGGWSCNSVVASQSSRMDSNEQASESLKLKWSLIDNMTNYLANYYLLRSCHSPQFSEYNRCDLPFALQSHYKSALPAAHHLTYFLSQLKDGAMPCHIHTWPHI